MSNQCRSCQNNDVVICKKTESLARVNARVINEIPVVAGCSLSSETKEARSNHLHRKKPAIWRWGLIIKIKKGRSAYLGATSLQTLFLDTRYLVTSKRYILSKLGAGRSAIMVEVVGATRENSIMALALFIAIRASRM